MAQDRFVFYIDVTDEFYDRFLKNGKTDKEFKTFIIENLLKQFLNRFSFLQFDKLECVFSYSTLPPKIKIDSPIDSYSGIDLSFFYSRKCKIVRFTLSVTTIYND